MINYLLVITLLTFGAIDDRSTETDQLEVINSEYSSNNQEKSFEASQFVGKFYFMSRENDSNTKLENLGEGKYIELKANYQFEGDVFEKMNKGEWRFDEDEQVLLLESKKTITKWKVKNVNAFGMILINIETNEKWTFAAE